MNSRESYQDSIKSPQCNSRPLHIAVVGGISLLIGVILLIIASALNSSTGGDIPFQNGIVIDAGSTHTEVFLYKWLGDKHNGTGNVIQKESCFYDGGISSLENPTDPVTCVENVTKSLSKNILPSTPLYLGATGGMRILRLLQPKLAEMILLAVKYSLELTGVNVKDVNVIRGRDEGMFSWISANFLLNVLSRQTFISIFKKMPDSWKSTYGTLDMGGASTQIAFAGDPELLKNRTDVSNLILYGHKYSVISKSFLCFGMMEALNRHQALLIEDLNSSAKITDPCLPKGNISRSVAKDLLGEPCTLNPRFSDWILKNNDSSKVFIFEGGSNFTGCQMSIEKLLNTADCEAEEFKMCPSKFDVFNSSMNFMAFSSFYHISSFLNSSNSSLSDFENTIENWCKLTWDEIKHHEYKKSDLSHLSQYCFGALYMVKWLMGIYGFDDHSWNNIIFQQQIDGTDLGWTLGYMINATNLIPETLPTLSSISIPVLVISILCSVIFIVTGVLYLCKYWKNGYTYSKLQDKILS